MKQIIRTNETYYIVSSYNLFCRFIYFVLHVQFFCFVSLSNLFHTYISYRKHTTFIKKFKSKIHPNIVKCDLIVKISFLEIQWCKQNFIWILGNIYSFFKFQTFCMWDDIINFVSISCSSTSYLHATKLIRQKNSPTLISWHDELLFVAGTIHNHQCGQGRSHVGLPWCRCTRVKKVTH
jgi:hypothetical protein